jgi:mycothiol synthase
MVPPDSALDPAPGVALNFTSRVTPDVEVYDGRRLSGDQVAEVSHLVAETTRYDGVGPLSEHARLHLVRGGGVDLLVRCPDGVLGGYAHVDEGEAPGEPRTAELVIAPDARGHGLAERLVERVEQQAGVQGVRFWAHGELPGAVALAGRLGWERVRDLWQMRRPLTGPGAQPLARVPHRDGIHLRAFRPGRDEAAWLAVNARAFAHHPEQGGWTATDLAEREEAPWFDPEGFLLAETTTGDLAGFHWTKQHGSEDGRALGEVYVLGVDPAYQGGGLGGLLTLAGLHHLQDRGIDDVMLYVEADNTAAVATYRRYGFEQYARDVMYQRRASA